MLIGTDINLLNLAGLSPTGDFGPLTGYTSKRGKPVWYLKAPPKEPPTGYQTHYRNVFRLVAMAWAALSPAKRAAWLAASRRAGLKITGYNLFLYWNSKGDSAAVRTVENQSGINLIS